MNTPNSLAQTIADAFNRHGRFTARVVENNLAVEIRYLDTGRYGTQLWLPDSLEGWVWLGPHEFQTNKPAQRLPSETGVDDLVAGVAASLLGERAGS